MSEIRVSEGTAGVLGLKPVRPATAPRTAYLMLGEGCSRDCAFCAQARGASGPAGHLARVSWPAYPEDEVLARLASAARAGSLERVCLQTVAGADTIGDVRRLLPRLVADVGLPISASVYLRDLAELEGLLALGLQRIGIAIDAATPDLYRRTKHGDQAAALAFLAQAAAAYPGRVSTHLIFGLGETEREALAFVQWCLERGITVGLFAFTPVRGTAMAEVAAPPLEAYRRLQGAAHLMRQGAAGCQDFDFSPGGELIGIRKPRRLVADLLADGRAFETSGCIACNRPYYNERPGQVPYNYPRSLTAGERATAAAVVLALVQDEPAAGAEGCSDHE